MGKKDVGTEEEETAEGYWCVVCQRFLPEDECGVIVHDNKPHPDMNFADEAAVQ